MKNNKPRSREHRTKPMTAGATKMVKVHLPQSAFDQFKELERAKHFSEGRDFPAWPSELLEAVNHPLLDHPGESGWKYLMM